MNGLFANQIKNISALAEKANPEQQGDYINEADGLLYCGKCRTRKQCRINFLGEEQVVFCICSCKQEELELDRKRREAEKTEARRRACFDGSNLVNAVFDNDDGANEQLSRVCRAYAKKFSPSSRWLLLYGDCGTGKSFAAACILNELIDRGYSARFATVSRIEKELFDAENKAYILDKLSRVDILCIDDFGAERGTEYMQQIVFDLIDTRSKSGKPCIITTNLSSRDFSYPKRFDAKRIYSRILEHAITLEVGGSDRRVTSFLNSNKARLAELLGED